MPLSLPDSPYGAACRQAIDALGATVDRRLEGQQARLTMGGEPTFVAVAGQGCPEWETAALGDDKRRLAGRLLRRLETLWGSRPVVQDGLGKCYPGEEAPRWALGCYWRLDGQPAWRDPRLLADLGEAGAADADADAGTGRRLLELLVARLGFPGEVLRAGHDGTAPAAVPLLVLPLLRVGSGTGQRWASCRWSLPEPLELLPGSGPPGLRLPLAELPEPASGERATEEGPEQPAADGLLEDDAIRVALCLRVVAGVPEIFLPPVGAAAGWLELVRHLEEAARQLAVPVRLAGYPPPPGPLLTGFQLTPDPGVLEVNLEPRSCWADLVRQAEELQRAAGACGLAATRRRPEGGPSGGTGGGRHLTLGSARAEDSVFFRRPDLLRSLVRYWQRHPGLSYAFAGLYTGGSCQAPRIDEGLAEELPELALALERLPSSPLDPGELGSRLRFFFHDLTGNAHRAEFCLDKLWPPEAPRSRLGLVELRGFEMQAHCHLDLAAALLVRALTVLLLERPEERGFLDWGDALEDRFALPYFIARDLERVAAELAAAKLPFQAAWLRPQLAARYPVLGAGRWPGGELELRRGREPWPVLPPDRCHQGQARRVEAADQRIQLRLVSRGGLPALFCNGVAIPLEAGDAGEGVGGIRFRARTCHASRHPDLEPLSALRFEVADPGSGRTLAAIRCSGPALAGSGALRLEVSPGPAGSAVTARRGRDAGEWVVSGSSSPLIVDLRRGGAP